MKNALNVGMIGLGAFMGRQHLPNIAANPKYRIYTLCDLNADLLARRVAEFKPVAQTACADDVFRSDEIDVIFVGTRSEHHGPFAEQAARHGKHVFVEKPMTTTFEQTRELLDIAAGSDIRIGVGFNRRYAPSAVRAKALFDGVKEGPANLIYRIVDDHFHRPRYIFDMNVGRGHLLQEGCHIFDYIAWFLGAEPVEIFANGPMETDNFVLLKYSDGSSACILCGGKGGLYYPKELMEAFCNRTTVVLDQFFELRADGPAGDIVERFPLAASSPKKLPSDSTMTDFYEAMRTQREAGTFEYLVDKGHAQEIDAFADAILSGRPFAPGAIDGARATICALKGYASIESNQPVTIRPDDYGLAE